MKKTIWSLAALMMLMSATMITSCSNDLDEVAPAEEVKENVVTLTIKMPEQAQTRVGIDDGTLKLTGWEKGDVVKVYHFEWPDLSEGVTFTCTNPSEGTFTGTLPDDKSLSDYHFAVYGRDVKFNSDFCYIAFSAGEVRDNLKDCICLGGPIDGDNCTMSIYNNVIKVTNNGSEVTGAWFCNGEYAKPYGGFDDENVFCPWSDYIFGVSFDEAKITIPSGVSYIFMPKLLPMPHSFVDQNEAPIIPEKNFEDGVVGKLYKVTIN